MTNAQQNTLEVLKRLCEPFHVHADETVWRGPESVKVTVYGMGLNDEALTDEGGNASFNVQPDGGLTLERSDQWPTTVEELTVAVDRYYELGNSTGGALHIVLDDGNLGDGSIQFCLIEAEEQGDRDALRIGVGLLRLSMEERERVYKPGRE